MDIHIIREHLMTLTTNTLISYEVYCKQKRCNVRYAFYCECKDADKRINKLRGLDGIGSILRQDTRYWVV